MRVVGHCLLFVCISLVIEIAFSSLECSYNFPRQNYIGLSEDINDVPAMEFHEDNRYLALADRRGKGVNVYDTVTQIRIATVQCSGKPRALKYSPDYSQILVGLDDGFVYLYDPNTLAAIANFSGHTSAVAAVAFNTDGSLIFTG